MLITIINFTSVLDLHPVCAEVLVGPITQDRLISLPVILPPLMRLSVLLILPVEVNRLRLHNLLIINIGKALLITLVVAERLELLDLLVETFLLVQALELVQMILQDRWLTLHLRWLLVKHRGVVTWFDLALAGIQSLRVDELDAAHLVHHRLGFGVTLVDTEHLFVVDENLRRQALDDPRVHESIERCDTLLRVPLETLCNEIMERVTLAHENLVQRLRPRNTQSILGVSGELRLIRLWIEEVIFPRGIFEEMVVR